MNWINHHHIYAIKTVKENSSSLSFKKFATDSEELLYVNMLTNKKIRLRSLLQ